VYKKLVIIGICVCSMLLGVGFFILEKNAVDISVFENYKTAQPSVVLDDEGQVLARFELDKRATVSYDKIPAILVKAFLAAEDHAFFDHYGVSLRGIVRSFFVNLYRRRYAQGASTITQQLARGMFLSYERTLTRKIQEVFLAIQLERQFSKEQILELYLNNIYFGGGIYGVEAACRRFWNKPLDQVTVDEAAMLAAIAASARLYSPINAPANALKRRNVILHSMQQLDFITPAIYEKAIHAHLYVRNYAPGNPVRLYLQEWIRIWAESKWGKDALYHKGLRIKTTINIGMQEKAERAFSVVFSSLRKQMGESLNGGMMSIEPSTGRVKVMVGGFDFRQSQYNRAIQAHRQMGSSFKPILYALALKAGIGADSVFVDEPLQLSLPNGSIYQPQNWNHIFEGPMTLVKALTISNNIIAVKLFLKIGGSYVAPWAKQFGFEREVTEYPSAALGTAEVTVEENVAAFNVFANNGVYVKPYCIEWVKDQGGSKIWETEHHSYRILDMRLNSQMVNLLMQRMILAQQQSPDGWFDAQSIGKTGSTNGAATTWFVGATPGLTTALYVGRDDNKPMGKRLFASSTTFPVWKMFYKSIKHPKKQFVIDPSLHAELINWLTGEPADDPNEPNVVSILK